MVFNAPFKKYISYIMAVLNRPCMHPQIYYIYDINDSGVKDI